MRSTEKTRFLITLAGFGLAVVTLRAQTSPVRAVPATVPALFLSDIHFDPFADAPKVAELASSPASAWTGVLAAPASATQRQGAAALQAKCPVRGLDTNNTVWESSLRAIRTEAAHARFITISGDLLAHSFDCKYHALMPKATHADYVSFIEKTARYLVHGLHAAVPGAPIYIAMGNNDSGCADYQLDASHDEFLAALAKVVAETLPTDTSEAERAAVLSDFAAGGSYNAPLPREVANTRMLVIEDMFFSPHYATCANQHDAAPGEAQLAWLGKQLASAREQHQKVWVMGHIPPGVDLYYTMRRLTDICGAGKPVMFLGSDKLSQMLAANADIVRLGLFGHTHSDEMRLLVAKSAETGAAPAGVPVKLTASITPVNGNRPSFTVAQIDPATATLVDYTVVMGSNLTGVAATWTKEYTYSTTFHRHAFNAEAVGSLIRGFQADPSAKNPLSEAYLRIYFPGDASELIKFAWPQYGCTMDHDSAEGFSACSCKQTGAADK